MKSRGYDVFAVNLNMEQFEGETCYPNLRTIPNGVDAAGKIVEVCAAVGHVWMHYNPLFGMGNSSTSQAAVEFCHAHDINVIDKGCPMMFGPTADVVYKCMR
jgi:uncharacterized protein